MYRGKRQLGISVLDSRYQFFGSHVSRDICYATVKRQKGIMCYWANLFRIGPLLSIGHLLRTISSVTQCRTARLPFQGAYGGPHCRVYLCCIAAYSIAATRKVRNTLTLITQISCRRYHFSTVPLRERLHCLLNHLDF